MPNPEFDGVETGTGDDVSSVGDGDGDLSTSGSEAESSTGDGDGDSTTTGTTTTGDGDGDGDPGTGDGDGDPNTGDGDGDPNQCADGLELCVDQCVDLKNDVDFCGSCDISCAGNQVCGLGDCLPKRYVFVTSVAFQGNFGGIPAADELCQDRALEAQLPGNYKAWLSDGEQWPLETFPPGGPAAFILRNGPIVAYSWTDFVDGQLEAPIDRNEFGDLIDAAPVESCQIDYGVWTGTTAKGEGAEPFCAGWSTASAESYAVIGNAKSSEAWSQIDCEATCDSHLPIYCVQQ